jgi:hypothetical protein
MFPFRGKTKAPMSKLFTLFILLSFTVAQSVGQTTVSGTTSTFNYAVNSPAVVVDNSIAVSSSLSVTGALVSISTNFNSGDLLTYTTSLPGGVAGSYSAATGVLTFTGTATAAQYQQILRSVTFATSSSNVADRTIAFNLGNALPFAGNDHFYEYVSTALSWADAKAAANAKIFYGMTGYLATITSAAENNFIQSKLSADGWIGASDDYVQINLTGKNYSGQLASEGKWFWVTGPERGTQFSEHNSPFTNTLTYANWNTGEPNNSPNEHYAIIYSSGAEPGKWNDLNSSNTRGFVVEYGGNPGDPVVTLTHRRSLKLIATSLENSNTGNVYALHATPTLVDPAINVYSYTNVTDARVTISSGLQAGDLLSVAGALPAGVTSAYNASTALLTFSGTATPAQWQALFRSVRFSSTSNVIGNRIVTFSLGNLVSGSNGHFYQFVSTPKTWTTAKADASAMTYLGLKGYLATITSATENEFIREKLTADGWIGASDNAAQIDATPRMPKFGATSSEGRWHWVTGPEAGQQMTTGNAPSGGLPPVFGTAYNNWNTGEPNNSGLNEAYAQFYGSGTNVGKWNDLNGTGTQGSVVEYGGLSTDPLLALSGNRTMLISAVLASSGLRFEAVNAGRETELKWSTSTELNTKKFDVLYSKDGVNFSVLGDVRAAGNSSTSKHYKFTHSTPVQGANYYQLRSVDLDGSILLSEVKIVKFASTRFTISPNPVDKQFTVTNPFGQKATLTIKSISGAEVGKRLVDATTTVVDVSSLAPGVYFARIYTGNAQTDIIRFIKN